jgi:ribosomal-protein-alanine N-acetyltransferase
MTPEALAVTHARAFAGVDRGWSSAEFAALLQSPGVFAVGDDRAFALGRVIAGEAELLTLATDSGVRRQGRARAALAAFEAEARARGAARAFLEVAEDNAAARGLYAVAGWEIIARRAAYYPRTAGPAADALVLAKPLGADPHPPAP